jgi:hypothetical protein
MTVVVNGDFENDNVGSFDLRINHLPVDKIDVGHSKEKSEILAVGIFDIAPDTPFRFFDGNHRIATHYVIVNRLPVALMHETHMGVIERVVDVVEVVANPPQRSDVQ